jgi:excisionase family DNA binding protein
MSKPQTAVLAEALEQFAELVARRVLELQNETALVATEAEPTSPWLSIERAAGYLDWPKQRLYKLPAQGAIPHYKHDGRLLFNRQELDAWLAQPTTGAQP